jgi:hypothetical protein
MAKAAKRKPPSRVRYEQAHPTVSSRVPIEIYQRLQAVKKAEGKSFTDILKIGLGLLEARIDEKASIQKQARAKGYKAGYAKGKRLYGVTYACNVCGEIMAVTGDNAKQAIKEYMEEHRWGHASCQEKRR